MQLMLLLFTVLSVKRVKCIPDMYDFLLPLEEIICTKVLLNLTGQSSFIDTERHLMALPPRLGGLGTINPTR